MNVRFFCKQALAAFGLMSVVMTGITAPVKTLHVLLTKQESVMDPAVASDITTVSINENIFSFSPLLGIGSP